MRRVRTLLCATLVAFGSALLAHAHAAHAQGGSGAAAPSASSKAQAKKLFDEGVELEKKSDYAGALAKYKEAEQITVTPGLRFHKGYCLEMIGKLAAAFDEYDAADRLAREQNKQDVHTAILVRMDPLRARVPQIAIRVATPAHGAEVQVDGVTVPPQVLEGKSMRVEVGEHTVTAHAAGFKEVTRKVVTPEAVTTTVDLGLERVNGAPVVAAAGAPVAGGAAPAHEPPPPSTTEPPGEEPPGRSRALPILTTTGAVVLAGAGVAFFVVAGGAQTDGQRDCLAKTACDDERSRVRTFDALALGSFIGAAGLGIASIVLWTSKAPAQSALAPRSGGAPHARVLATPAMLGVEGSF